MNIGIYDIYLYICIRFTRSKLLNKPDMGKAGNLSFIFYSGFLGAKLLYQPVCPSLSYTLPHTPLTLSLTQSVGVVTVN